MRVKRALISVSDKTGLIDFARQLHSMGVEIVSTGGTMKTLRESGIPVIYVSDVTGFPEIMDGRVKTLNPHVHGGILAIRDNPEHVHAMQQHGIIGIDLVVVNLYPFRQTIAKVDVTLEEAVENIDIGGPAMIRAAAKNFRYVTVVVNPSRYGQILSELVENGGTSEVTRMSLAKEAYDHTSSYDAAITNYLSRQLGEEQFPSTLHLIYEKNQNLRYGENPHQQAAFYRECSEEAVGIANARQLHGKELSFNNIVDLEAAYALAAEFEDPAAFIIKHTNPCGSAQGASLYEAFDKAYQADPISAFGGIVGVNRPLDQATAEKISTIFIEAVIAPAYSEEALTILTQKKNIRLIEAELPQASRKAYDLKRISGGLLVQDADVFDTERQEMKVVTKRQPDDSEWREMLFAWKVVKHVKSNAIVISRNGQSLGVGAGQMNRVGSAAIALEQAGPKAIGAVMASDAFFPFGDTVEAAAKAGIRAIIQPGGSVRDGESIQMADQYGIAMVFTGTRHFKH